MHPEGFSEQLVALPDLPAWFERPPIPRPPKARSELGLPEDATVYLCAQTLRKVHPEFYVDKAVRLGTDRTLRAEAADAIASAGQIFESPAAASQLEDVFTALVRSASEAR